MKKNKKLNNKINYDDTLFVEVEDKNISPIIKSIIGVILIFFICLILYIYNISPINRKNTEIKGIYFESSMTSKDLYKILKRENLVRNEFFYKLFCKLNNVTKLQK